MPCPSEVPRCGARRLIAARMVAWSFVGRCTAKPLSLKADYADLHATWLAPHKVHGGPALAAPGGSA